MITDVLIWGGIALTLVGFGLSFVKRLTQPAMAALAFGATAEGTGLLMERLDWRNIIGAIICYGLAMVAVIAASIKEREADGR